MDYVGLNRYNNDIQSVFRIILIRSDTFIKCNAYPKKVRSDMWIVTPMITTSPNSLNLDQKNTHNTVLHCIVRAVYINLDSENRYIHNIQHVKFTTQLFDIHCKTVWMLS